MNTGIPLTIESISIENFRPYQKLDLKLSQDKEKSITIIEGNNSLGKTSLMNAVYWCLYGEEKFFLNQGPGKPRINQKALNDTMVGNTVKARVKVTFSDYVKTTHIVTRELVAKRQDEGKDKISNFRAGGQIDSGFIIDEYINVEKIKDDGNWKTVDENSQAITEIQRIIPKDLSEFILFNGEMLDTFFIDASQSNVRIGIEKVSGISITQKAIEHWDKIEKQYRKKVRINAGEGTEDHERVREEMESNLHKHNDDKKIIEEKIKNLIPQQKEIENILENHPLELINNLESERTNYKSLRKTLSENRDRINQNRIEYIRNYFSPIVLTKVIMDTYSIIQEAEEDGQIPPPINVSLLKEKIEGGYCICGIKLNEYPTQKANLDDLLKDVKNSVLASTALEGRESLRRLTELPNTSEIHEKLNKFREDYNNAYETVRTNEEKIQGITHQLEEFPQETIREYGKKLHDIDEKLKKHGSDISRLNTKIEATKNTIAMKDERINEAAKKSKSSQQWSAKAEIAKKAKETLEEIREELLEEIKKTVQDRTEKLWKGLISRGDEIKEVKIDDDYKIRVIDEEGVDSLKTLSAGQTLNLALSFISAIREVTDINYPMIIDSPFGKVSGYERMWAAEDLPKYLPQTQMTFLVTNSEYNATIYDSDTKKELPPISSVLRKNEKVWKEFVFKRKSVSKTSSITEMEEVDINE
jgi:DNA sulfur modification protein DndD